MSLEYGRSVLDAEIAALQIARAQLGETFTQAVDLLEHCQGRVCACGMGKAGIIAQKVAATLSSTGSPAYALHPADALHGDLGMVGAEDVILLFSNSGVSEEITRLVPCLRRIGAKLIAITGNKRSTLAAHADVLLWLGEIEEACPLKLAPTATTTAMLALGDALALATMRRKGFEVKDYAELHPAGALGRKVLPVEDIMRIGDAVATVSSETTVGETILAITQARAGAAVVIDEQNRVLGVFCDGDLRRGLERGPAVLEETVDTVMTTGCTTIQAGQRAGEALELMRAKRIAEIPVVNESGMLLGVADMKGLLASL